MLLLLIGIIFLGGIGVSIQEHMLETISKEVMELIDSGKYDNAYIKYSLYLGIVVINRTKKKMGVASKIFA
jgi:hypothetical protein